MSEQMTNMYILNIMIYLLTYPILFPIVLNKVFGIEEKEGFEIRRFALWGNTLFLAIIIIVEIF